MQPEKNKLRPVKDDFWDFNGFMEVPTHPQVEHFLWCLQNIDKQTEHTYPMSIVFLWQKQLQEPQPADERIRNSKI